MGAKMFSCCGARCAPCRRGGCVAHRPRPLARLLPPATGSSRLAPHRRPGDRLWCKCLGSVWPDLLDNHLDLTGDTQVAPTNAIVYYGRGELRSPAKKAPFLTVPFSICILMDYFQCTAKSHCNPADFESRDHRKIFAKLVCLLAW